MQELPSIFISYNPGSDFEETLAIRLHTIGAVHGFQMFLPERNSRVLLSLETQARINQSEYYILFSTTSNLSEEALKEIQFAFEKIHDKNKIIIIYDTVQGDTLTGVENCTKYYFDKEHTTIDSFIQAILGDISTHFTKQNQQSAFKGILLAGLGLMFLGSLASREK